MQGPAAVGTVLVLGLGAFPACGTDRSAHVVPVLRPVAAEADVPHPTGEERELLAALREAAQVRGLAIRRNVRLVELDRRALRAEVQRFIRREVPARVIEGNTALLELLGLVPQGFNYVEAMLNLVESNLAGFYDPLGARMFIAADLNPEEREQTLRHELVHALQDQHFDLRRVASAGANSADAQSALHALAEGDATSAMFGEIFSTAGVEDGALADQALANRIVQSALDQSRVPGILERSAVAPYADGLRFVQHLRRNGGWESVNRAWASPPLTTEQLLHPEKYAAGELPTPIAAPATPEGCKVTYQDVLGEQSLRLVLEEWVSRAEASAFAAGWDGDFLTTWKCPAGPRAEWSLRFDPGKDVGALAAVVSGALAPCDDRAPTRREVEVATDSVRLLLRSTNRCATASGPSAETPQQ